MVRTVSLIASSLVLAQQVNAFTVTSSSGVLLSPHSSSSSSRRHSPLHMSAEDDPVERGVSVDQDGKSNVWAIEPKVEVESKSDGEKTQSVLIAGAGLGLAAIAAAGILTNLPDPNQF